MKYSILITYYQNQNILKTALTLLLKTLGNRMDVEIIISSDCIFRLCRTNCTDVKSQSRGR